MAHSNEHAPRPRYSPFIDPLTYLRELEGFGLSAVFTDCLGVVKGSLGSSFDVMGLGQLGAGMLMAGDTLLGRAGGQKCEHLLISGTETKILVLAVGDLAGSLMLILIPREIPLGTVLWASRRGCIELRDACGQLTHPNSQPAYMAIPEKASL